uniref:Uncharacterized protein n=1 Tax=Arundo donax TaxID=35708 RepID=A0A0A8YGS1_ARUDO
MRLVEVKRKQALIFDRIFLMLAFSMNG